MKIGEAKYAVMRVEKGINFDTPLKINNFKIKLVIEGETYKYLAQDENITYSGQVNKERASSEYFKKVHKIWISELSGLNKQFAHNCFVIPCLHVLLGYLIGHFRMLKILTYTHMTSNFN